MPKKVMCDDCPIFHWEDVYDSTCGLGYKVENISHTLNAEHLYNSFKGFASDECNLEFVRFVGGEFRPTMRATDLPSAASNQNESDETASR